MDAIQRPSTAWYGSLKWVLATSHMEADISLLELIAGDIALVWASMSIWANQLCWTEYMMLIVPLLCSLNDNDMH